MKTLIIAALMVALTAHAAPRVVDPELATLQATAKALRMQAQERRDEAKKAKLRAEIRKLQEAAK